jgi:cystathionine gamma-synthase
MWRRSGETGAPFDSWLTLLAGGLSTCGVESLVAHPATMTHASMTPEARLAAGIGDTLFRLSVGLERVDDLMADLEAALAG